MPSNTLTLFFSSASPIIDWDSLMNFTLLVYYEKVIIYCVFIFLKAKFMKKQLIKDYSPLIEKVDKLIHSENNQKTVKISYHSKR